MPINAGIYVMGQAIIRHPHYAIESVARLYGLGFLPLTPEIYDFLLVESRRERAAVRAFLSALRDEHVRERVRALGMRPAEVRLRKHAPMHISPTHHLAHGPAPSPAAVIN
jgi:hypothetical protein